MTAGAPAPPWAPDHPVIELVRRRAAAGSRPGARDDGAHLALSVEGGGMRGVVTCAMLAALDDLGCSGVFDTIYGSSSGSVNAAYFLAGGLWHSLSIYYDDLATARFLDLRRALRGRPVLDVDFAFDTIFELTKPLDYEAVLRSPIPLHVAVTLVDELRVDTPSEFASRADLRSALRAGTWLPLATRGSAEFRGRRAIDGGALVSHPSRFAIEGGCSHLLSLSSRGRRSSRPDLLQWYAGRHLERMRPGLGASFRRADRLGEADRAQLAIWRHTPGDSPAVLDVFPRPDAEISRQEIRSGALQAAARAAYETMWWAISGDRVRAYPRLVIGPDLDRRGPEPSAG